MIEIIGAGSFIGSSVLKDLEGKLAAPSSLELDITDIQTVKSALEKNHPSSVISFAAYTNLAEAEKERGDKSGIVWKVNVQGAENLSKVCNETGTFLVHISTDAVFPGTDNFPGPYPEDATLPDNPNPLSWYAYTKLKGEEAVQANTRDWAIVRISYPFGNLHNPRDFALKTIQYIKMGYSLFNDQNFTPTFLPDLSGALNKIVSQHQVGIYHVVCSRITTPFNFAKYIADKLGLENQIQSGSINDYKGFPRVKLGGLENKKTQEKLGLKLHQWQEG